MIERLNSLIQKIREWWGAVTCPPDRIWMRCGCCGQPFAAGPDHVVEVGLVVESYKEGMAPATVAEDDEAFRSMFCLDDAAMVEMEAAEEGDFIQTGAEHWCDICLRDAGLTAADHF